nr:hypothetical protein [uncultured Allomuricauda sp.]
MKESKMESLRKAYQEGNTTLNEEHYLFNKAENSGSSLEAWSAFVRNNKSISPKDFNDRLWESFQAKRSRKRKKAVVLVSAAASVLLFVTLFMGNPGQRELSYSEKEALLNQALDMFPNTPQKGMERNIIYENEMIILYTTSD